MTIQYLGYEEDQSARTCLFRVFNTAQPERQFELSVKILLLKEYEFKIQDLPDLCFSRLKNELSIETEQRVPPLQMSVSRLTNSKIISRIITPRNATTLEPPSRRTD
jgi:hypothetical protein